MELVIELGHDDELMAGQVSFHVIQFEILAEFVRAKSDLVHFGRQEQTSVLYVYDLVRVGLEQRLMQVEPLEKGHSSRE